MLNFENTKLRRMVVHQVGNRGKMEGVKYSKTAHTIKDDYVRDLLMMYFTKPFDGNIMYQFRHDADLNLNEVYTYVRKVFEDYNDLYDQSVNIANHLYEKSNHPKIKKGELYIVEFAGCQVDDEICNAIGIFKSENKDKFLKVYQKDDDFEIDFEDGINIHKLDKGCIIFDTEKENGCKVVTVDKLNPTGEAAFWKDEFLHLQPIPDDYYLTRNYMEIVKEFSKLHFNPENDVEEFTKDRREQIDFNSKAARYFEEKENFDLDDFASEVIGEPEVVEEFKAFKEGFEDDFKVPELAPSFVLNEDAQKEVSKKFRSVLKLDRNFHLYVHGGSELLEKGYDEKRKMNYYKIFFNEEN